MHDMYIAEISKPRAIFYAADTMFIQVNTTSYLGGALR